MNGASSHPRVLSALPKAGLLLATFALLSCQNLARKKEGDQTTNSPPPSTPAPATPTDSRFIYKMADVESVAATLAPGQTRQATVTISGLLHDGATSLHEVKQQRISGGVFITVITSRPRDAMATLAIIPFERTVEVDLAGLPPGTAVITVNGKQAALELP